MNSRGLFSWCPMYKLGARMYFKTEMLLCSMLLLSLMGAASGGLRIKDVILEVSYIINPKYYFL